jgi:hypothetical protein
MVPKKEHCFYLMTMVYGCIAIRQNAPPYPKSTFARGEWPPTQETRQGCKDRQKVLVVLGFHIEGRGKITYELVKTCRGVDLGDTFDTLME